MHASPSACEMYGIRRLEYEQKCSQTGKLLKRGERRLEIFLFE